jgi:hypothetical protein
MADVEEDGAEFCAQGVVWVGNRQDPVDREAQFGFCCSEGDEVGLMRLLALALGIGGREQLERKEIDAGGEVKGQMRSEHKRREAKEAAMREASLDEPSRPEVDPPAVVSAEFGVRLRDAVDRAFNRGRKLAKRDKLERR